MEARHRQQVDEAGPSHAVELAFLNRLEPLQRQSARQRRRPKTPRDRPGTGLQRPHSGLPDPVHRRSARDTTNEEHGLHAQMPGSQRKIPVEDQLAAARPDRAGSRELRQAGRRGDVQLHLARPGDLPFAPLDPAHPDSRSPSAGTADPAVADRHFEPHRHGLAGEPNRRPRSNGAGRQARDQTARQPAPGPSRRRQSAPAAEPRGEE